MQLFKRAVDEACYPFTSQNSEIQKCKNLNRLKCGSGNKRPLFRISSSYRVDSQNIVTIKIRNKLI